jgi:hypothetical protein
VFKALEDAVAIWTGAAGSPVSLSRFPSLPEAEAGICVFEGRIRELAPSLPDLQVGAIVTALPRPNQAFWTLSALWSGWLGGSEAVLPFKAVLRRQRYDWRWHTTALHAALDHLTPHLPDGIAGFLLIPESEPGLLMSALIAADRAGWAVDGIALREGERQTQIEARKRPAGEAVFKSFADPGRASEAARAFLAQRGEPAPLLPVLGAVFLDGGVEASENVAAETRAERSGAAKIETADRSDQTGSPDPAGTPDSSTPPDRKSQPEDGYAQLAGVVEEALSYRAGFLRYNAGKELDTGQWWLRNPDGGLPLADRVEYAVSAYLLEHPGAPFADIDRDLCAAFPGLDTPDLDLLTACVDSYGLPDAGGWTLRPEDDPVSRKNELNHNRSLLITLGERLGFTVDARPLLTWSDSQRRYLFHLTTTAALGELLGMEGTGHAGRRVVLLPGSRANLLLFKRGRDPRLDFLLNDWHFVKFRHLRALEANPLLVRDIIDEMMTADRLTFESPQLNLF